jgi:hypothetical protein
LWQEFVKHFLKTNRYSLGIKIDQVLVEVLELASAASFSPKEEKLPYIKRAIIKLDVVKFLIQTAWETGSLNNKRLEAISKPLAEAGRQLGAWHNNLKKQTAAPIEKRQ